MWTWRSLGLAVVVLGGLAACPGASNPGGPDAQPDGSTGSGLTITWRAVPEIPGDAGNGVTIDEGVLIIRDLRAIGDSAPGDHRTQTEMVQLTWTAEKTPAPVNYPLAPPGLYSHLELRADGGLFDALVIRGHAHQGGTLYPFEMEIDGPSSASIPINVELPAGGSASVQVAVDLGAVARAIDWETAPLQDGLLHYEEPTSGPAAAALAAAFSVSTAPQ
jgi:hypothetical protein